MDEDALFAAALEKNNLAERDAFLDEACDGNAGLRAEVQELLKAHSAAGSFLKRPAGYLAPTALFPGAEESAEEIGDYKLLQIIGEGGMGVVYMAEQTQPVKRRVALKVIKPGMDSKQVIARFEAERQALAMMDHPNIAKVLDAGTTQSGRPYFVMELVKGIPITEYCDQKRLSPEERLELFIPVCQAVQHAHQKGVIHRDIKPSNILIAQYDDQAVPKIIDFGLAKALSQQLTEKTLFTQYGQVVGSIDYMSPEQSKFNQLDVDTRTDVYSLGVVLYELLSGATPFDRKRLHAAAFNEMLRIIQQEEPPRPSIRLSSSKNLAAIAANRHTEPKRLSLLVRGDLDWIVMKAMDKERNRRYETSNGFAEDIRRYLEHQLVQACPPSPGYRFRKFARRNRALLASTATVAAALVVGLVGTTWSLFQAIEARKEAVQKKVLAERAYGETMQNARTFGIQAKRHEQFEALACGSLNQLTAQIGRDSRLNEPELQPLRKELLNKSLDFWDKALIDDEDPNGKPGPRRGFYRLQRAVCLARAGHHSKAFDEAQALRGDTGREDKWADDLIRICALCAAAAEDDRILVEKYVDAGIKLLETAAQGAAISPPPAEDPDLAALRSHKDFRTILEKWSESRSD